MQIYDCFVGFNKIPGLDVYFASDPCFKANAAAKHGPWFKYTSRYRNYAALEDAVFNKASNTDILLISQQEQAKFQHYYQTPNQRFHHLPPPLSKDRIPPPNAAEIRKELRNEFLIGDDQQLVLLVGSAFKTKGLDRAIKGLAALPQDVLKNICLLVVGDDDAGPYQKLSKQLGLTKHIIFAGARNDIQRFFISADLLLHPARTENTGTVLLEAMLAGLPTLVTDICGFAFYIQESDSGLLLSSPFNQPELNQKLQHMLSSDSGIWRSNALNYVKDKDFFSMPEKAVAVIEQGSRHAQQQTS